MTETLAIQLSGLTKRYGPVTAVDALDLDVPAAQVLALLGPNGAGKSTATEIILGLTVPDAGEVHVFGVRPIEAMRACGCLLNNAVMQHMFLALPVIPQLRVSDLSKRRAAVSHGEEQLRIFVATDGLVAPIHKIKLLVRHVMCARRSAPDFLRLLTRAHECFCTVALMLSQAEQMSIALS